MMCHSNEPGPMTTLLVHALKIHKALIIYFNYFN